MDFTKDIPHSLATAAHAGTSWSPEDRGRSEVAGYASGLQADYDALSKLATTDEKRATLDAEFERYRAGYASKTRAWLTSRSRCVSSMIAGPSNFPVRRMEKRNAVEHKRMTDLVEFRERALKAIRKAMCPELAPIMSGDSDAVTRMEAKLVEEKALHAQMKAVNAAHKAFLKKPESLETSTLPDAMKARVRAYKPAMSWEPHPFAPYQLSNLGANIRSMEKRLAHLKAAKAAPVVVAPVTENGIRLEDSPPDNRVRLFFPGKPDVTVRDALKAHGFRWTPSLGCWQAFRSTRAMMHAEAVAKGA